jgi:uncharacterized protein
MTTIAFVPPKAAFVEPSRLIRFRIGRESISSIGRYAVALWFVATAMFACLWTAPLLAAEGDLLAVPKLEKRVTDLTATLSRDEEERITTRIREFEQKKGGQIAVLIVGSTQPEPIFDFALRVGEAWKLGRKGVDDGVLFVIAKDDRKMQILNGPGVQGVLTDVVSRRIIAEIVAPRFREAKFAEGVFAAVDKIAAVIDGEALPPPPQKRKAAKSDSSNNFILLAVFGALFVAPMLRAMLGRFLGASATAGVTGMAAWWIAGGLFFPIIIGVIVFIVAIFAGAFNFSSRGNSGIGGFGGGGWSSGSGGSSDSFSGGGGGFDGGGASGDW